MKIKHTLKAGNHLALANNCFIESFRVEVKALSRLVTPIIRMEYIALTVRRQGPCQIKNGRQVPFVSVVMASCGRAKFRTERQTE